MLVFGIESPAFPLGPEVPEFIPEVVQQLTFRAVFGVKKANRAIRLTLPSTICSIWEWKITRRQFLNLRDDSLVRVPAASICFKCAGLTDSAVRDVVTAWVGTQAETIIVAAFAIFRAL